MILRIILSLLFEHGKNIIGPQFGWLPSSDGANASVPRRDLHHEMDGAGDRNRLTLASRKCADRPRLAA
jgi:hypothetical protein